MFESTLIRPTGELDAFDTLATEESQRSATTVTISAVGTTVSVAHGTSAPVLQRETWELYAPLPALRPLATALDAALATAALPVWTEVDCEPDRVVAVVHGTGLQLRQTHRAITAIALEALLSAYAETGR
jgi:hypothetical protein